MPTLDPMKKTEKEHRKPAALRKEDSVRIRVTAAQKRKLVDAAERSGLGLSSWLLSIGLREADPERSARR